MNEAHEALLARALVLHGDVQGALQDGFAVTLTDLQQLRAIPGDATGKLSLAFQSMLRQAHHQQAAARRLADAHDAEAVREIQALADDIAGGSMLVVQGPSLRTWPHSCNSTSTGAWNGSPRLPAMPRRSRPQ